MGKQINQVVARLSAIEHSSVNRVESSKAEQAEYSKLIDDKKSIFDKDLTVETNKKLELLKSELKIKSQKELEEWRIEATSQFKKIDEVFAKNHSKMANDIFAQLIKQ